MKKYEVMFNDGSLCVVVEAMSTTGAIISACRRINEAGFIEDIHTASCKQIN